LDDDGLKYCKSECAEIDENGEDIVNIFQMDQNDITIWKEWKGISYIDKEIIITKKRKTKKWLKRIWIRKLTSYYGKNMKSSNWKRKKRTRG